MSPAAATTDDLRDLALPDEQGRDVRLGDLWADTAAVLVWLRHYGWLHCRDHAVQLHRAHERFEDAGARVQLIGMGTPRRAAWFRAKYAPSLSVLADEARVSYRAAGLKVASATGLLGPGAVLSGVRHAARSGVVQGRPMGNVAQLGGALVVAPGGEVLLSHRAGHAGDSADPDALLAALAT